MKNYKTNARMSGILYLLGTVFGITSAIVGGKVIASTVQTNQVSGSGFLDLVVADSSRMLIGSFFILLMGIALVAMTAFLYPIFKKDNEELAMGMLLFRGVMEGTWYFITTVSFLVLFAVGQEYIKTGANSTALQSLANVIYKSQDLLSPLGSMLFLIGTTCLYISFYRTKLIPRWLTLWGLIGVVPYMAYALLHFFGFDNGIGFYLQMPLAVQEIVLGLWLVVKGFNSLALDKLITNNSQ